MSKRENNKMAAIEVDNVSKFFKLPHEKTSSVKGLFLNGFRKKKTYDTQKVLNGISFKVKKGEFVGIVGRNGSGKSTLLKILGEIYQPTGGTVKVNGSLTPFIELGIGFNPELTGRENVFLNGAILGLTRKEIVRNYDKIVEFAELEEFMDKKLKNYSSGMQVRLAFSISLQAHNDILLIDEVLAVGDASFQRKCFKVFKDIKLSGKTVIFVTHDMGAVKEYCDKAILIEKGEIVSSGSPDVVANDYLQLFNPGSVTKKVTNRWGDQTAQISDIKAYIFIDKIRLSYKVEFLKKIDNPIFGLIIKNLDNIHIIDSNTKWKQVRTGDFKTGEQIRVEWNIPNVFKTGSYNVTVATAHSDGLAFYDWQENAHSFDVVNQKESAGIVILEDTITVNKVK